MSINRKSQQEIEDNIFSDFHQPHRKVKYFQRHSCGRVIMFPLRLLPMVGRKSLPFNVQNQRRNFPVHNTSPQYGSDSPHHELSLCHSTLRSPAADSHSRSGFKCGTWPRNCSFKFHA